MSLKIRKILRIFISITIFLFILHNANMVLERKDSNNKYALFFEQVKNGLSFDILFFGTSHMINAVFPMELWDNYGYVSYNFGGHANRIATTYWVMQNAFDYTIPKLVVIDCSGISDNRKVYENEEYVHLSLDAFPFSMTKVKAVSDLIKTENQLSYLWNFVTYHNRWNDLNRKDFDVDCSYEKGAESMLNVATPGYMEYVNCDEKRGKNTVSSEYLQKIIKDCQQQNIDVLLTYLPFPATKGWKEEANYVQDIALQYNVQYINFFDLDVVNFNTDCYDSNSHLNQSGGYKITEYIGQYIKNNYDIEDHRNDMSYNHWNDDYQIYRKIKNATFRQLQNLDQYLLALADPKISTCFYIKPGSSILYDQGMQELIRNISPKSNIMHLNAAANSGTGYFCIIDKQKNALVETMDSLEKLNTNTFVGNVFTSTDEEGKPYIIIKENPIPLYDPQKGIYSDITILVFDNETENILDIAAFNVEPDLIPTNALRNNMFVLP